LAANRLSTIRVGTLRSLTQLRTLDLSDNPLTVLHRDLLASAHQLATLNVSGTRLTRLVSGTTLHAAHTLSVLDLSRCGKLVEAPDAGDISALTRLRRLSLPAHTCRCDVINYRSVVEDLRSRQRPRPTLFCGVTIDIDAVCSDTLPPTAPVAKPLPVPSNRRADEPLPYDPKLGWYTAAVLSGLLFAFIACVGLEKAEKRLLEVCMARYGNKNHIEHHGQRRLSTVQYQQQQCHQHARTTASVCTVADLDAAADSFRNSETSAT